MYKKMFALAAARAKFLYKKVTVKKKHVVEVIKKQF